MTTRITLELPDSLMERIAETSRRLDRSPEQVILALLEGDIPPTRVAMQPSAAVPSERVSQPLGTPPTEEEMQQFADMMQTIWDEDDDEPVPTHEELWAMMPVLDPPLSQTVIDMREDRF